MKTQQVIRKVAVLILSAMIFTACGKEGPAGPQGEQGPQGESGAQGPQGVPGNANVVLYNFDSRTFTKNTDYILSGISRGRIDSSLVLAYYNPSTEVPTAWYPIPGIGSTGDYETRYVLYQSTPSPSTYKFRVFVHQTGSSGYYLDDVTWKKTRIFLIKTSEILSGERKSAPPDPNDYHAVCAYYGIPE